MYLACRGCSCGRAQARPLASLVALGLPDHRELNVPAQRWLPELQTTWPPTQRFGCEYSRHISPTDGSCPPHGAVQLVSPESLHPHCPPQTYVVSTPWLACPVWSTIASVLPADMFRVRAFFSSQTSLIIWSAIESLSNIFSGVSPSTTTVKSSVNVGLKGDVPSSSCCPSKNALARRSRDIDNPALGQPFLQRHLEPARRQGKRSGLPWYRQASFPTRASSCPHRPSPRMSIQRASPVLLVSTPVPDPGP